MKNSQFLLLLSVLGGTALLAFRPAVPPTHEVRELAPFTQLAVANSVRVELRQGSPQRVELEAAPADLAQLATTVKNGRLRISTDNTTGKAPWYKLSGPVTIFVTMPVVQALSVDGSGDLLGREALQADELSLNVNGSGKLVLGPVAAKTLNAAINGAGNVELSGSSSVLQAGLRGSGQFRAHDLRTENADISITGSGAAHIFATRHLHARLTGSGNVYVAGGAEVSSSVTGSGRVQPE